MFIKELKESSRESKESQRKQLSFNTGCLLRSGDVYMEILEDNLLKYGTLRKVRTLVYYLESGALQSNKGNTSTNRKAPLEP